MTLGSAVAAILYWASALALVGADTDWPEVWDDLARLESLERDAPAASDIYLRLSNIAEQAGEEDHAELLRVRLTRWFGEDAKEAVAKLESAALGRFTSREAWLLAEVLEPGQQRARAVRHALEGELVPTRSQQTLAWRVAVDEARALRLAEGARPIQTALHERYQTDWSAIDLALTLSRLGDSADVDRVLEGAIERERAAGRPTAALWSRWGIAALGFGDESRARDYLGRALAEGSSDAALVLGRMDLIAGRRNAARANFLASLRTEPPGAWAARGWGMTLLPEPYTLAHSLAPTATRIAPTDAPRAALSASR